MTLHYLLAKMAQKERLMRQRKRDEEVALVMDILNRELTSTKRP
jgi:hypothetical protein